MLFSLWGQWDNPAISFNLQPSGYVLLILYVVLLVWTARAERHHLRRLTALNVLVWLTCILLSLVLGNVLTIGAQSAFPLALLVGVPIVLAGFVGVFPAAVTGLTAGLMHGVWLSHDILAPFEFMLWGIVAAQLLRQDFKGLFARVLRLPFVASVIGSIAMWTAGILSCTVLGAGPSLFSLSVCSTAASANLPFVLLAGAVSGAVVHGLFALLPGWAPRKRAARSLPTRTIRAKVLIIFVPIALVVMLVVLYAVNSTVVGVATRRNIAEAGRTSELAGERAQALVRTGFERLSELARSEAVTNTSMRSRAQALDIAEEPAAFFSQVIRIDSSGAVVDASPAIDSGFELSSSESDLGSEVIESGTSRMSMVHRLSGGSVVLSLLCPVIQASGDVAGAMIGRLDMEQNPQVRNLMDGLQLTAERSEGFVVDERGLIIVHPDSARLLTPWYPDTEHSMLVWSEAGSAAFIEGASRETAQLMYRGIVPDTTWSTVISTPYAIVLESAREIVTPIALLLVCIGLIVGGLLYWLTTRLTSRLDILAMATADMAQGRLDSPVAVSGDDEVGRLGSAIESMRVGLRTRLKDFALLLRISRAVSANLGMEQNLEPILTGAVNATQALSARVILLSAHGEPQREVSYQQGGSLKWKEAEAFSEPLLQIVRNKRGIKVRNAAAYPTAFSPDTAMALAFPLIAEDRLIGVFVAEYGPRTDFAVSEIEFLGTLAGQAAVAIQSARLFEAVASERKRLAAILTSASDGIIVTDSDNRLVLANPAAQQYLDFDPRAATGKAVAELSDEHVLVQLLAKSPAEPAVSVGEFTLSDGRTLYASISPIVERNGDFLGRVVVMRDISDLKEVAAAKSEFVATVSHDLRAPLTVIKGYATLAETGGPLVEKQKIALEKIRLSVTQMTELIDNLLDLGRIEAGVDVTMSSCELTPLIRDVAVRFRPQAEERGLTLTVKLPLDLPPVAGDPLLLGQAIANLIDNALKYTPSGFIHVEARLVPDEIVIQVRDSGIGIPAANLPRLFEKFYRVKSRETIKIHGTGLGLSIVKSIAELHGGRVWAESVPNQGSTFNLALPVKEAADDEVQATS